MYFCLYCIVLCSVYVYISDGEISYVSANRISQQLEMKDQENQSLTLQLQQLQLSRSALLQEVSYLSARNAELEEKMGNDNSSAEAIARLDKENMVLLLLLGEKEEELENVLTDLKDVKNLYKSQLETLYDKFAPSHAVECSMDDINTLLASTPVVSLTSPMADGIGAGTIGRSVDSTSTPTWSGHGRFMTSQEKSRLGSSPDLSKS